MEGTYSFDDCCRKVLRAYQQSKGRTLAYAASYASAGIGMEGETRRVQALYLLSNLGNWRGEEAKAVKAALKEFAKK